MVSIKSKLIVERIIMRQLQTELSNIRGLFTGTRRKEIETRLTQIEVELAELDG